MTSRIAIRAALLALAGSVPLTAAIALAGNDAVAPTAVASEAQLDKRLTLVGEYGSPGLEAEISGILPVPGQEGQYYALVNKSPPYRPGQKAMIDPKHRGSIVTVDRDGRVLKSVHVADDDFGGLAYAHGRYYAALTNAAEMIEFEPDTGKITRRYALPSPAGGLDYDPDSDAFIAQLYVGHPQLLKIDRQSGKSKASLFSEESAMGLIKIDGDWLCSWASGWDPGSFSEMRVIDQGNGDVLERTMLDRVHSAMGVFPDRKRFLVLVTTNQESGATAIREYSYRSGRVS